MEVGPEKVANGVVLKMGENAAEQGPSNGNRAEGEDTQSTPVSLLPMHWGNFNYYLNQQQSSIPTPGTGFQPVLVVNNESQNVPTPSTSFHEIAANNITQHQSPSFRKGKGTAPRRGRGRPPGSRNNGPRKQTNLNKPLSNQVRKMVKVMNYAKPRPSFNLEPNMTPPMRIPSILQPTYSALRTPFPLIRPQPSDPLIRASPLENLGSGLIRASPLENLGSGLIQPSPLENQGSGLIQPSPLENQGSGGSLPDPEQHQFPNSHGTPSSSPQNNVAVKPHQPIADDSSRCLEWKNNFNCGQLFDRFLELKRCKMDNRKYFQAICRLFVHHPLQLQEINKFATLEPEKPSHITSTAVNFQDMNQNIVQPIPVITLDLDTSMDSNLLENSIDEPGNADTNFLQSWMLVNLDMMVKDHLNTDPVKYQKYVSMMDDYHQFRQRYSNTSTSLPNLQFQSENREYLKNILELLDEPELQVAVRDLFKLGFTYEGEMPVTNNTLDSSTYFEENIVEDEVQCLQTEEEHVTSTSSDINHDNLELENSSELPAPPCLPDLKCYESLPCESVPINPVVLMMRLRGYSALFNFFPTDVNGVEIAAQNLDDRAGQILEEDLDKDQWKIRLLQALSRVFLRAPHLRGPIEELLGHELVYTTKDMVVTPFSTKTSTRRASLSSIPFEEGSYNKYLPSKDNKTCCSGRTQLDNEVLNDELHSKSSDTVFRLPNRSDEEVTLDAVEDARYEVDMRLYKIERTIDELDCVHKKMLKMSSSELESFQMEDFLQVKAGAHKETIEWFYKGERVMVGLQKFPTVFVPRVLEKLIKINMKWIRMRSKWNHIFSADI